MSETGMEATGTVAREGVTAAQGLRELADWLDAHPDLAVAVYTAEVLALPSDDRETVAAWARGMGHAEKSYSETLLTLRRKFGPVELRAAFYRDKVCERIVTGVRHVPAAVIPEKVIEAHDEEIVEWNCEPILATAVTDDGEAVVSGNLGEELLLAEVGLVSGMDL